MFQPKFSMQVLETFLLEISPLSARGGLSQTQILIRFMLYLELLRLRTTSCSQTINRWQQIYIQYICICIYGIYILDSLFYCYTMKFTWYVLHFIVLCTCFVNGALCVSHFCLRKLSSLRWHAVWCHERCHKTDAATLRAQLQLVISRYNGELICSLASRYTLTFFRRKILKLTYSLYIYIYIHIRYMSFLNALKNIVSCSLELCFICIIFFCHFISQ